MAETWFDTLWHEIITKIVPWELFFGIWRRFCTLKIFGKGGLFQGIAREIRNFSKITIVESFFVSNNFASEGKPGFGVHFVGFFLGKHRQRAEYCFESPVSEKSTHWAVLSFTANSVHSYFWQARKRVLCKRALWVSVRKRDAHFQRLGRSPVVARGVQPFLGRFLRGLV